jgi:hypothetical protein
MANEIKYEYKTVQAVRGADNLVISKMEKDGWELVERAQGRLRSTLNFRRPKKPLPWLQIGGAAAAFVILSAAIGIGVAFGDRDEAADTSDKPAAAASDEPAATSTPTVDGSAAAEPITIKNNPEFAALLKTRDTCDDLNLDFAANYKGQMVAFDGSIVHMERYSTGYDFLLGPGDEGPGTTVGPDFKYENVNISELRLAGEESSVPVVEGDRFRFVARIVEFNTDQCIFHLTPVSTEPR